MAWSISSNCFRTLNIEPRFFLHYNHFFIRVRKFMQNASFFLYLKIKLLKHGKQRRARITVETLWLFRQCNFLIVNTFFLVMPITFIPQWTTRENTLLLKWNSWVFLEKQNKIHDVHMVNCLKQLDMFNHYQTIIFSELKFLANIVLRCSNRGSCGYEGSKRCRTMPLVHSYALNWFCHKWQETPMM